jgi:hypothetical protein
VWKLGVYHQMQIAFARQGYDQQVFFAAVLVNWMALTACAVVVSSIAERLIPAAGEAWPLLAGAFCFFAFYAQPGVLAGLTEGLSWLLVAAGFLAWLRRSLAAVAAVLCLSVVQRETIPIVFAVLSASMLFLRPQERRFHAGVIGASAAAFLAYVYLRLVWAPAPDNGQQLGLGSFAHQLQQWPRLLNWQSALQIVLTQNLLIGLALACASLTARRRASAWPTQALIIALYLTAVVLMVLGVGTLRQSNNIGRVVSVLTPIAAALLAAALARLASPATPDMTAAGGLVHQD